MNFKYILLFYKAHRRQKGLDKVPESSISSMDKVSFRKALVPEMMSSEDEHEDENGKRFFKTKKPKFRTRKFQKLINVVDKAYVESSSKRSKEQMIERKEGSPSKRPAPTFWI